MELLRRIHISFKFNIRLYTVLGKWHRKLLLHWFHCPPSMYLPLWLSQKSRLYSCYWGWIQLSNIHNSTEGCEKSFCRKGLLTSLNGTEFQKWLKFFRMPHQLNKIQPTLKLVLIEEDLTQMAGWLLGFTAKMIAFRLQHQTDRSIYLKRIIKYENSSKKLNQQPFHIQRKTTAVLLPWILQ